MNQTRQLLIQTAQSMLPSTLPSSLSSTSTLRQSDYYDMYLDIVDLVDDKKWDSIITTLHSFPHESMSYVAKKLIGRLLRERNFTDTVVSLLDYISSGCSLEMRIYQILENNGSIDAMRYYLERGAPFHLEKHDIPFPTKQFSYIVPLLTSQNTFPKDTTIQMYYGPVHTSLVCQVIDQHQHKDLIKDLSILFSLGADPNVKDFKTGNTPLIQWAITFYKNWRIRKLLPLNTLTFLLENGSNPLIKNNDGKDAIYYLHFWLNKADNECSIPKQYIEDIKIILSKL